MEEFHFERYNIKYPNTMQRKWSLTIILLQFIQYNRNEIICYYIQYIYHLDVYYVYICIEVYMYWSFKTVSHPKQT